MLNTEKEGDIISPSINQHKMQVETLIFEINIIKAIAQRNLTGVNIMLK
jgi:hypothetical protein